MKKKTFFRITVLVCFLVFHSVYSVYSQTKITPPGGTSWAVFDFETPTTDTYDATCKFRSTGQSLLTTLGSAAFSNPDKTGINNSNFCFQLQRNTSASASYASFKFAIKGVTSGVASNCIDMNEWDGIQFDVLSTQQVFSSIKLELQYSNVSGYDGYGNGVTTVKSVSKTTGITVAQNTWGTVTLPFSGFTLRSGDNSTNMSKITSLMFYPNNGLTAGSSDIIYLDNINLYRFINPSVSTLSGFTYSHGAGPSAELSFTVSGTSLTGNITVTPPTNYEISTTSGSGFATNPISLTQTGGVVNSSTIYVRLKSGLTAAAAAATAYSGNIVLSSTNVASVNVACSGSVSPVPTLDATTTVTAITGTTASSGGNITLSGSSNITARGVCWYTLPGPTVLLNLGKTTDGTGTGSFTSNLTGLTGGTTYYVRSYATNSGGTAYAPEVSFTTPGTGLPTLAPTTAASVIAVNNVTSGGNVISDGGSPVTARGVCWGTSSNPTVTSNAGKTTNGTGTGSFASTMTSNLWNWTTFYVRAYATNGNGTAYGAQISFTTLKGEPAVQPTSFAVGAVTTSAIPLSWVTGNIYSYNPPQDGYIIKLSTGTIDDPVDGIEPADVTAITNGIAYKRITSGTSTTASSFTGMTAGTMYNYKIYSYTNSGTNINYKQASPPTLSYATLPNPVTTATFTAISPSSATISWTAATGYNAANHSTLVFVKEASAITTGTPTAAPSTYTANAAVGLGTSYQGDADAKCVYNGDGTSLSITGLIANTTYYVLIYTVVDASNSNSTNSYSAATNANATTNAKASQVIVFNALAGKNVGDPDYSPDATSATSGTNPITYTSSEPTVATILNGNIHITGTGTTTITASQSGNADYLAATNVTQDLVVSARQLTTISSGTQNASLLSNSINDIVVSGNGTTLTIDADKTENNLTLEPDTKLDLSNNTLTLTGNLILKAGKNTSPSINVTHAMSVVGNVSLQKTLDNTKWYFMSFPSTVDVNSITQISGTGTLGVLGTNWWIKYYDGASRVENLGTTSNWKFVNNGETLAANKGYIISLSSSLTGDFVLSFPLNKDLLTTAESAVTNRTVPVGLWGEGLTDNKNTLGQTVGENHKGWNLLGIPYLSKFAGSGVQDVAFLTLPKSDGIGYDQFSKSEVGRDINPFEAFFVQASSATTTSNLAFATGGRQLNRSLVQTDMSDRIQINFSSETGTDKTNIIMDNDQSAAYEINRDLEKWIATGSDLPQVYTKLDGINYAFNALPMSNVQNLPLAYYNKKGGVSVISVDASQAHGLSALILTDISNGAITDLLSTNYSFDADPGTTTGRFLLTARRIATDNEPQIIGNEVNSPIITISNEKILLGNLSNISLIRLFDAVGRMVTNRKVNSSSVELYVPVHGIYTIQLQGTTEKLWTKKIVL